MKNQYFVFLVGLLVLTSCSGSDDQNGSSSNDTISQFVGSYTLNETDCAVLPTETLVISETSDGLELTYEDGTSDEATVLTDESDGGSGFIFESDGITCAAQFIESNQDISDALDIDPNLEYSLDDLAIICTDRIDTCAMTYI